jgi:hypothetical protein
MSTGRKTLLIRGLGAHRKIVPISRAPHTAAARELTAPDGDPARAFQSVSVYRRDGDDKVGFCACCARPIDGGAVIRGEEICCSVECALENADRISR